RLLQEFVFPLQIDWVGLAVCGALDESRAHTSLGISAGRISQSQSLPCTETLAGGLRSFSGVRAVRIVRLFVQRQDTEERGADGFCRLSRRHQRRLIDQSPVRVARSFPAFD